MRQAVVISVIYLKAASSLGKNVDCGPSGGLLWTTRAGHASATIALAQRTSLTLQPMSIKSSSCSPTFSAVLH